MSKILRLSGFDLEEYASHMLSELGLTVLRANKEVRLRELDPDGRHTEGSKFELDYLIPYGSSCLVGEISGSLRPDEIKDRHRKLKSRLRIVNRLLDEGLMTDECWNMLGVEDKYIGDFKRVESANGFTIIPKLEPLDVNYEEEEHIAYFYRSSTLILENYREVIGQYARPHLLHHLGVIYEAHQEAIQLNMRRDNIFRRPHVEIAGEVGEADLYTFEVSPYLILPIAQVFRRDELPDISESGPAYQRLLDPQKISSIRRNLIDNKDFMFPNSILGVLSDECVYQNENLTIPKRYGNLQIIDGQHRLFSYANEDLRRNIDGHSRIMVSAIQFKDANHDDIHKYSARTFVEINRNQTPVESSHLDAIGYRILDDTSRSSLASEILVRLNERQGSSLFGLFNTNQTGLGVIKTETVKKAIESIANLNLVKQLQSAQSGKPYDKKIGYENLLQEDIYNLEDPETFVACCVSCLERYFNYWREFFHHDWPERGKEKGSSFEYAKVIAGIVKLLRVFIDEGLDWEQVKSNIKSIRDNALVLAQRDVYDDLVLDASKPYAPDASLSDAKDRDYFNYNRGEATPAEQFLQSDY